MLNRKSCRKSTITSDPAGHDFDDGLHKKIGHGPVLPV
jgi:hypothetical protein